MMGSADKFLTPSRKPPRPFPRTPSTFDFAALRPFGQCFALSISLRSVPPSLSRGLLLRRSLVRRRVCGRLLGFSSVNIATVTHAIDADNADFVGDLIDDSVVADSDAQSLSVPTSLRLPAGRGFLASARMATAVRERISEASFFKSFSADRSTMTRYIAISSRDRRARLPTGGSASACGAPF